MAIPSALFFQERFLWLEALSLGIVMLLVIALGVVYRYDEWIAGRLRKRLPTIERSLSLLKQGLDGIASNKAALLLCLAISLPIWFFEVFSIFLAAQALGFHLPLVYAAISGVVAFVAQTVPLTPAGIGVHEASITGTLGLFNVPAKEALPIALVDHFARGLVIYVFGLIYAIHIGFASRQHFRERCRPK
ncbi:Lysylphosphatidylglycerol synthase TM region [uncultured archaeon]|nr:Lysylphosphatidylglycerol synthase TM region [uncultured archaeon]